MHFAGTVVMLGVAYHVYSDLDLSADVLFEKHVSFYDESMVCGDHVRLVEVNAGRVPDDYQELPGQSEFD